MFPQQPQQQFRKAGADVQIFYGSGSSSLQTQRTWNKPVGVSHIYMMLIGSGSQGDGSTQGGGSGAVTVWYGAAQHVPNSLVVNAGTVSGANTTVSARFSNSAALPSALLTANGAVTITGGVAMTANQFTASGFFQSVAGQDGSTSDNTASATTFLSGGSERLSPTTANYGYSAPAQSSGYFQLQPIIVGLGGSQLSGAGAGVTGTGIGCGSGSNTGNGGVGMILIASW